MKQKTFSLLIFIMAFFIAGSNLMAQINTSQKYPGLEERLDAVAKHKKVIQQAIPDNSDDTKDDYCIPGGNCSSGDGLGDFTFAGIENLNSGCSAGAYGDFTYMQGTAEIGNTYTASLSSDYWQQTVSIWIDFDHDTVFSETERILTDFELYNPNNTYDVDILISGASLPGIHRMRVGVNWFYSSSPDPCATFQYGEWEDYHIEITGDIVNNNAAVVSIDMPDVMIPGDVIPLATVENSGIEMISFPVTLTEPITGYSSTVQVVDLAMGQSLQLEFDTWTVENGTYNLDVCTELIGDEDPDDDCQNKAIIISDQPRQKVVAEFFTGTW